MEEERDWQVEMRRLKVKEYVISAAETLANKLNEEIARGHTTTAFTIAILLAAFKDFQDAFFGILGDILLAVFGIGTVPLALTWAIGLFVSATLTAFMWGKGWFLKTRIWIIWGIFGLLFENLPGFEQLPIETLTVLYAWHIVRKRSDAAEEKIKNLAKLTEEEINALNTNIAYLDEQFITSVTAQKKMIK